MDEHHEEQVAVVLGQRQLIAVCCMFLVVLGLVATLSYVTGRSITAAQMCGDSASMVTPPIIVDPMKSGSSHSVAATVSPTGSVSPATAPATAPVTVPATSTHAVTPPPAAVSTRPQDASRTVTASMDGSLSLPARASESPARARQPQVESKVKPSTKLAMATPAVAPPTVSQPAPAPVQKATVIAKPLPSDASAAAGSSEPSVASTDDNSAAEKIAPETPVSPAQPASGETFWQVGVVDHKLATEFTQKLSSLGLPVRVTPGQSAEGRRVLVGPFSSNAEIESARKLLAAAGYQHFLRKF